jgi:hypothetical protein
MDRVTQLEQQVRLLAAALDLWVDDPANVIPSEVIALIQQHKTLPAGARILRDNVPAPTARQQESSVVRFFRSGSLTLIQAKRIVDELALEKISAQE